jgi:hypothetical protein
MTDVIELLSRENPVDEDALRPSLDDLWPRLERTPVPARAPIAPLRRTPIRRRTGAFIGTATVAGATVVAVLVLGTTGGGPAPALAGWSARPTHPAAGQLQAAEARCASNPSLASLTPTLTDTRGPYSLLLYVQPTAVMVCISGLPSTGITGGPAPTTPTIAPRTIKPEDGMFSWSLQSGTATRFITGQAGPDVIAVTLVLDDGSSVEATIENGWFAAWWPSLQGVQSAELTTTTGAATQPLNLPTLQPPPTPAQSPQQGATAATGSSGASG